MVLKIDEARRLAWESLEPNWGKSDAESGLFYIPTEGREDKTHFLFQYGNEEWIVDKDPRFMVLDGGLVLVSKKDGNIQLVTYLDDDERYDAMKVVSID